MCSSAALNYRFFFPGSSKFQDFFLRWGHGLLVLPKADHNQNDQKITYFKYFVK